jgi:hypothetical protein
MGIEPETSQMYTYFDDASIVNYCAYEFNNVERINFYSDPDAEKIIRKQLHTIKNHYIQSLLLNPYYDTAFKADYINIIKPLIYDVKNPLKFVAGKSSNQFLSCRDTYLMHNKNSDVYNLYKNMVSKLKTDLDITKKKYTVPTMKYYIT